MNIASNLEWSSYFFPDRPVISQGDSIISYVQLNQTANRVATALIGLDIQPNDSIGIYAPNSGDWIAFYFGVLKAGAVPITLSSQLSKNELSLLLNHSQPRKKSKTFCMPGLKWKNARLSGCRTPSGASG